MLLGSAAVLKQFPGFSDRLNQLCDQINCPALDQGRAIYLSERFGVSKSGARKWLRENTLPRNLRSIVESLLEDLPYQAEIEEIIAWLYHGDLNKEPINSNKSSNSTDYRVSHTVLSTVYVKVHEYSARHAIELHTFDKVLLTEIYSDLIHLASAKGINKINDTLLAEMFSLSSIEI